MLGVCACNIEEPVPEDKKQESAAGTVTEAVERELVEITQAVTEKEAENAGNVELTETLESQPEGIEKEALTDGGEKESVATEDTGKAETADELKKLEPEELVLHVLTNAKDIHFTDGGEEETELLGYEEEKDAAYFIMKKQSGFGRTQEEIYIGMLNPETGELLQCQGYGNTTADAVMIEKETGLYIVYATECTDFGFYSGRGGVLLAKDGTLTPVWPLNQEGVYDEGYWSGHTAKLNGETLEIYKVIITETRPDGIASEMKTELEQTLTLDEILAGAV